jgi:hypothetical protein
VDVADPHYGASTRDFAEFPANYRGGGRLTAAYFTKA